MAKTKILSTSVGGIFVLYYSFLRTDIFRQNVLIKFLRRVIIKGTAIYDRVAEMSDSCDMLIGSIAGRQNLEKIFSDFKTFPVCYSLLKCNRSEVMDLEKRLNYRKILQNWMSYYRLPPPVVSKLYTAICRQKTGLTQKKGEKENGSSMERSDRTSEE